MLKIENRPYTLMTMDPGLNNNGLAIFRIQHSPVKILSISTILLSERNTPDSSGLDDDLHEGETHKRLSTAGALRHYLEQYRPDVFACESPFFDRFRPSSFMTLSRVTITIFDTVTTFNPNCHFEWYAPLAVKKAVGMAGVKGKEAIELGLSRIPIIVDVLEQDLSAISEHERDAIAVGYRHLSGRYPELSLENVVNQHHET